MRACTTLGLLTIFGLIAPGCGGGNEATITGTVVYDGKPLETGTVAMYPADDGPSAYGSIQPDGTFRVSTGKQKGLAPGEYRISVQASGPMPEATAENDFEPTPESLIPQRYGSPDTSDLKATINPGKNQVDLKLVSP